MIKQMPKDEFDFEDPFELNGIAFHTQENTTNDMAECFVEEFMRMGYGHEQILALFRNPHYLGPHMALEKRGEPFVRDLITEVFARRGKLVTWPDSRSSRSQEAPSPSAPIPNQSLVPPAATSTVTEPLTDPMGMPIPKMNL